MWHAAIRTSGEACQILLKHGAKNPRRGTVSQRCSTRKVKACQIRTSRNNIEPILPTIDLFTYFLESIGCTTELGITLSQLVLPRSLVVSACSSWSSRATPSTSPHNPAPSPRPPTFVGTPEARKSRVSTRDVEVRRLTTRRRESSETGLAHVSSHNTVRFFESLQHLKTVPTRAKKKEKRCHLQTIKLTCKSFWATTLEFTDRQRSLADDRQSDKTVPKAPRPKVRYSAVCLTCVLHPILEGNPRSSIHMTVSPAKRQKGARTPPARLSHNQRQRATPDSSVDQLHEGLVSLVHLPVAFHDHWSCHVSRLFAHRLRQKAVS